MTKDAPLRIAASRLRRTLFACTILVIAAGPAFAADPSATLTAKSTMAGALLSAAASGGSVPVIIELHGAEAPLAPQGERSAGEVASDDAAREARVRSAVDPFIADLRSARASARAAGRTVQATGAEDPPIKAMPFLPIVATTVSAEDLERIAADPRVKSIERDGVNHPSLAVSVPLIGGVEAASLGATGRGYTVGILDSGVQYNHPFLAGRIVNTSCHSREGGGYKTLCPNGTSTQYGGNSAQNCTGHEQCSHGTHVAGIAVGYRASGSPSRGVAPQANFFPIQVFSRPTAGGPLGAFDSDIIAGLQDLYKDRATYKIVAANLSLGGGTFSQACDTAAIASTIKLLREGGIATVVGAGNDGRTAAVNSPGCVTLATTVAASTTGDKITSFTNMSSLVDVVAPGEPITSSIPTSAYAAYRGTSMAAPHVTGAFAALKSAVPAATISEIENALKTTGVTIVDNRSGGSQSKPRIDVYRALLKLKGQSGPPANDTFARAINVAPSATADTVVTGSNVSATLETGEPRFNDGVNATVWWKFTAARSEMVSVSTIGSSFDTTLGIYLGSAVNALREVAKSDNFEGRTTSQATFQVSSGQTYYVQIGGRSAGTVKLTFSRPPSAANDNFAGAIAITAAASGTTTATGDSTYSTIESGEPLFMSSIGKTNWWKIRPTRSDFFAFNTTGSGFDTTLAIYRGTSLAGLTLVASNNDNGSAKTSRLTALLDAGVLYYVQIGGLNGAGGSIKLNFAPTTATNDNFAGATSLTPVTDSAIAVFGNNLRSTLESGEPRASGSIGKTNWWKIVPSVAQNYAFSTSGSSFDTTLALYRGRSLSALTLVAYNNDNGGGSTSRVTGVLEAGVAYYVQIGGFGGASGSIKLNYSATALSQDSFAGATTITMPTSGSSTARGSSASATVESGEPRSSSAIGKTLWWKLSPTQTRNYAFNTSGSSFDTTLSIYRGTSLSGLELVAYNNNYGGATSRVAAVLESGQQYYVQVGGNNGEGGSVVLNFAPTGPANDMIAGATVLPASPTSASGTNVNASVEPGESVRSSVRATAWWRFAPTANRTYEVTTAGSSFDTTLVVFVSGGATGMNELVVNNNDGTALTSRVRFSVVAGRTYYLQVGGNNGATGNIRLNFSTVSASAAAGVTSASLD